MMATRANQKWKGGNITDLFCLSVYPQSLFLYSNEEKKQRLRIDRQAEQISDISALPFLICSGRHHFLVRQEDRQINFNFSYFYEAHCSLLLPTYEVSASFLFLTHFTDVGLFSAWAFYLLSLVLIICFAAT